MPFGWDRYLLWHQRGTHALIGTLADAIVFALVLRVLLGVWPRGGRARGERAPAARLPHLVLAAWLGCLGHVLLDVISGGTIRLFAPFSTAPYGVPWMAMADPLIAVPLAIFLLASWRWRQRRTREAIRVDRDHRPGGDRRREGSVEARGDRCVCQLDRASAWRTVAGHRIGMGVVHALVRVRPRRHPSTAVMPDPPTLLRVFEIDAWSGDVRAAVPTRGHAAGRRRRRADSGLDAACDRASPARALRSHLRGDPPASERGRRLVDVLWSDIRFCWPTDCALWFGGTFDRSTGALREQVVLVGSLRQTRAPLARRAISAA